MTTTQHPTDSMSDKDYSRYLKDTLPTLAPRPKKVCEALMRALSRRVVTLDEYDERFASDGYAGVEELLVERGLLDGAAQR